MVPSDLHLADGHSLGHAPLAGSSQPAPYAPYDLPPGLPADLAASPAAAELVPMHYPAPSTSASVSGQLLSPPGSLAGQQAPVARHLGIRLDPGAGGGQGGAASPGGPGGRRASVDGAGRGLALAHGSAIPAGMSISPQYGVQNDGRQRAGGAQHYQPYGPVMPTSSGAVGFPPIAHQQAFPAALGYPGYGHPHQQQSPLPSPLPQHQYHPQFQQQYPPYQQMPPPSQMPLPPGYAHPAMLDSSAGPMYAPGPAHLGHPAQQQMQQHAGQYPIAPAFATQQGTFYFMPRQQAVPQPAHPQYDALPPPPPPPLLPGPGSAMYELPSNGHHAHAGPGMGAIPSGLALSMPLSASSSASSLTPTGTATSSSHKRSLAPADPAAAARAKAPPKKKKAKPAKDQPKRFLCEFDGCGRAFARQFNLQTHSKSHYNIRDYDCAHCDKKFSRRHDRGRHCAAVHPEAVNEDLGARAPRTEDEDGSGEEYPDVTGLVLP